MLYLLPQLVDRAAERNAEHPAIRYDGRELAYGELVQQTNQLARVLLEQGVHRGDRVGLFLGKGLEPAVALYGAMKAGAAYVPLDPGAPVTRLAYIIRDCGIRHLVTESSKVQTVLRLIREESVGLECLVGVPSVGESRVRCVPWSEVGEVPAHVPDTGVIEQDLAYILYTSGSTGVPKGVAHTHRSALSFAEVAARTYGFRSEDRLSNHAPLHFDLTTLDFFSAAVAGATTIVIPELYTKLPASLSKLMESERLTVFYSVPFALVQLLLHGALPSRDLSALRWIFFGGEPFPSKHLRHLMMQLPQARFCNVYGPTETNGCTFYVVPPIEGGDEEPIPIGRPYDNVEAMIVDDADRPVPRGAIGELLVRSPTMMRGYWGRSDLNERAFYRRPAGANGFEDLFHRTGDLVRERPDGSLSFLGRKDRQVKIRGYRVELDEVESALLAHPSVEAAAAYVVAENGSGHIEASVTLSAGASATAVQLVRFVEGHLPSYAVPRQLSVLNEFPRTSTGKIDRLRMQSEATLGIAPA